MIRITWVEAVSGHHALVGHVDACFGLDRENTLAGDSTIIFGGVARNASSQSMILEDDETTLLFTPANGIQALFQVLTPKEQELFRSTQRFQHQHGGFTFEDVIRASGTTDRKAVSQMLKKGVAQSVFDKKSERYMFVSS